MQEKSDDTSINVMFVSCTFVNIRISIWDMFFSTRFPFSVSYCIFSAQLRPLEISERWVEFLALKKHQHQHSRKGLPRGKVWQEKQAPEVEGWKRIGVNEQVPGFPANTVLTQVVCFVCAPQISLNYENKSENDWGGSLVELQSLI